MILTYDLETYEFSKDIICGSIAYRDYKQEIKLETYNNKKDIIEALIKIAESEEKQGHKVQAYAHNADFDALRLIEIKDKRLKIIKATKPGIYAYKTKPENEKYPLYLYDSMKIFPMGLEKVGKIIGHEKTTPPKEIDNKMKHDPNFKPTYEEYQEIVKYNQNDCIVLLKALEWIKKAHSTKD